MHGHTIVWAKKESACICAKKNVCVVGTIYSKGSRVEVHLHLMQKSDGQRANFDQN